MPKLYNFYTRCRAPWTEMGSLKRFYLHSCNEGFPARATNVCALQGCTALHTVTGFQRHITFEMKSRDYSFTNQNQDSKLLAPILMWKCTPIWRNFIQVHAQKYFFYRHSENGVYNSPALRESTTAVTSKPPVSMATRFPPTDGNSPIYGINSYFVSIVTGFAWLRQNLFTDIYKKKTGNKWVIKQVKAHMTFCFMRRVIIN